MIIFFRKSKNSFTEEQDVTDYKDWQTGLGRRWNSLRFWFMIRSVGVLGLRNLIRQHVEYGKIIESNVKGDDRIEMICKRELALVCFRFTKDFKGQLLPKESLNALNKKLVDAVNAADKFHISGSVVHDMYFIRFVAGNPNTTEEHVHGFWKSLMTHYEKLTQ